LSPQPTINDRPSTITAGRVLAIVALTCVSYLPVLRAGFVWDDDLHVMHTPQQVSWRGLRDLWLRPGFQPQYYPLTHTSFWIEYHLWGTDGSGHPRPVGYHVVNVLLHAANAVLVWRVLRRLEFGPAFIVGVLFAVHPVCVESVAWISERKNTLSTLFYLLAAMSYLRFDPPQEPGPVPRRWGMYALATVLFVCALLSKSVTCSLPAALLLVIWWKRGRIELRRDVLPLAPWFVLGAVLGLHTAAKERFDVGASGAEWNFSPIDRVLIAGRVLWFYAGKLVFPWPLAFNYPRWRIDAREPWQYAFPLAALAVIGVLWVFRKRIGRGPLVAVLFFAGTLTPALGFFNLYPMRFSFAADHMQYLASIGLLSLAAAALCRIPAGSIRQAVLVPIVLVLAVLTYWQAGAYESAETLWRDTLAKYPDEWMPNLNLGVVLSHDPNRIDEAVGYIDKSLRLKPDQGEANLAMGDVMLQAGRPGEAMTYYQRARELSPRNFRIPYAIARLSAAQGDVAQAANEYRRTIELEPRFVNARLELADLEAAAHRYDAAVDVLRPAIELDPDDVALQNKLAVLLLRGGRAPEAANVLRQTVARFPDNAEAHANLAAALETMGDRAGALREYQEAARLKPDLAPAQQGVRRLQNGS
jgi:tetratricopeptide (TPR) repeat protein